MRWGGARARLARAAIALGVALGPHAVAAQVDDTPVARLVREGHARRQNGDLPGAIRIFEQAVAIDTTNTLARLHLGYALLAADRVHPAVEQFRAITRHDPQHVLAHRQLALLLSARGDLSSARDELEAARALGGLVPSDWLELGRVQARLGSPVEARRALDSAVASGDSTVRQTALAAIAALDARSSAPPARSRRGGFFELYSAPLYQSRFSLTTAQATARVGLLPTGSWRWTPYGSLRLVTDSRSPGASNGLRYSENVLVPALGFRFQPGGSRVTLYAEAGPAFAVVRDEGRSRPDTDVRVGAYLYDAWQWGGSAPVARRVELYADVNYLSRFEDDIFASAQVRGVQPMIRSSSGAIESFAKVSAVGDRRRFAWANVAEGSIGVTLVPGTTRRFVLMVEETHGVYLGESPLGRGRTYRDFRVTGVLYLYSRLGR